MEEDVVPSEEDNVGPKLARRVSNPPTVSRAAVSVVGLERAVARKRDMRRGPVRVVTTSSDERSVKRGE